MMSNIWNEWIRDVWDVLAGGGKVPVPHWLPHPSAVGFRREYLATPFGQCRDWVLALGDESRIHVHEYSDGRLVAHRDRFDPNRSLGRALQHLLVETNLGPVVALVGFAIGVRKALEPS